MPTTALQRLVSAIVAAVFTLGLLTEGHHQCEVVEPVVVGVEAHDHGAAPTEHPAGHEDCTCVGPCCCIGSGMWVAAATTHVTHDDRLVPADRSLTSQHIPLPLRGRLHRAQAPPLRI